MANLTLKFAVVGPVAPADFKSESAADSLERSLYDNHRRSSDIIVGIVRADCHTGQRVYDSDILRMMVRGMNGFRICRD